MSGVYNPCPKCGAELEVGFGLAGGGYGPYEYCSNEDCNQFTKWQEHEETNMTDNPDEARNIGVIAGRDEKGHPLTQEQVEERTKKKLEADAEKSEKVKEQLKKEADEATKNEEARVKADEDFLKKQKAAQEKADASKQAVHQSGAKAPNHEGAHGHR